MAKLVIGNDKTVAVPAVVRDKSPASYRAFDLDSNGNLTNSTTTSWVPLPTGTRNLSSSYMFYNAYQNTPASKFSGAVDLSSLTDITGFGVFEGCFRNCPGITSVDLSSLTTITGANAMSECFWGCSGITSVNLSSLTTVDKQKALNSCFKNCSGITSVNLSSLTTAGDGLRGVFEGCTSLQTINLPLLTTINNSWALADFCAGCTALVAANLPNLTSIANSSKNTGFGYFFSDCRNLPQMRFQSLSLMEQDAAMQYCFTRCLGLQSVWFYALTPSSFGTRTGQFRGMFNGCSNVTVHFPMAIQSTIESWSDVTAGFGGTNTTVLFDIVTTLTGADSNTYTRQEKDSTSTATAWTYNDTLYYTSGVSDNDHGVNEPTVGATIYSDSACTTAVTTISSIA